MTNPWINGIPNDVRNALGTLVYAANRWPELLPADVEPSLANAQALFDKLVAVYPSLKVKAAETNEGLKKALQDVEDAKARLLAAQDAQRIANARPITALSDLKLLNKDILPVLREYYSLPQDIFTT